MAFFKDFKFVKSVFFSLVFLFIFFLFLPCVYYKSDVKDAMMIATCEKIILDLDASNNPVIFGHSSSGGGIDFEYDLKNNRLPIFSNKKKVDTLWFYHKKTGIKSEAYYNVYFHDNKSPEEKHQVCDFIYAKNGDAYIYYASGLTTGWSYDNSLFASGYRPESISSDYKLIPPGYIDRWNIIFNNWIDWFESESQYIFLYDRGPFI